MSSNGTCGENLKWKLVGDTLTISGTGKMEHYGWLFGKAPWRKYDELITKVVIERGVTTTGMHAFRNCKRLRSVTLPDSLISIEGFFGCTSLESIVIPNSVTFIGSHAFQECKSLISVTLPDSLISIKEYTFCDCESLTSIQIPSSVTTIGQMAFEDCKSLTKIVISPSIKSIGRWAFNGCENLEKIYFPVESSFDIRVDFFKEVLRGGNRARLIPYNPNLLLSKPANESTGKPLLTDSVDEIKDSSAQLNLSTNESISKPPLTDSAGEVKDFSAQLNLPTNESTSKLPLTDSADEIEDSSVELSSRKSFLCPACNAMLSEPLPERCPVCNLEGLNRIFLNLEDYEDWKKNILDEHMKKLRNHKISVGYDGVLVLLGDGRLFGFGNNTQGQYCPRRIGEKIDKPEKIADNVISAAAGYNYSLYLDAEGKVHFLGNSGIPFKERFEQGNLVFKEVYAKNNDDIFWVVDEAGKSYIWGVINHNKKFLKKLQSVKTKLTVWNKRYWEWDSYKTQKYYREEFNHSSYYGLDDIKLWLKSGSDYKGFINEYGEDNLQIEFSILEKKIIDSKCKEEEDYANEEGIDFNENNYIVTLQPVVYFLNRYIFQPLETKSEILDRNYRNRVPDFNQNITFYSGSTVKRTKQTAIKCIRYNSSNWVYLEKNGTLHCVNFEYYGNNDADFFECGEIGNVADCSACAEKAELYFIDFDKKIWHCNGTHTGTRYHSYSVFNWATVIYEF